MWSLMLTKNLKQVKCCVRENLDSVVSSVSFTLSFACGRSDTKCEECLRVLIALKRHHDHDNAF